MNPVHHSRPRSAVGLLAAVVALSSPGWQAAAQEPAVSAQELAGRLAAGIQDGSSSARLKMEIRQPVGGARTVLQLQIKGRRTKAATDLVYQVLWPKERKGESLLLRKAGDSAPSGSHFVPPDSMRSITSAQMRDPMFGSDLSYEDLIENFFTWDNQSLVGTETVDRVSCQILESKPGRGQRSSYARVRSWIDPKRLVPLRVEKYLASGQVARRIDTTRVGKDDTGRQVPASVEVRRPGQDSITEIEGSNSRHDVSFSDQDFTPEALRALASPGAKPR